MFFSKKKYKVKLKGRSGLDYFEGKKKMSISSEFMSGSNGIIIYSDSIKKWKSPYEADEISEQHKSEILRNITENLNAYDIPVEWL